MLFATKQGYGKLPTTSDEDLASDKPSRSYIPARRHLLAVFSITLALFAALGLGYTAGIHQGAAHHHHQPTPSTNAPPRVLEEEKLHCGNSVDEALARNCTFDRLTLMWLPRACDRSSDDAYRSFHNDTFEYWRGDAAHDSANRDPVTDFSRETADVGFWGPQRQHLAHCAFMYTRVARAVGGDDVYDRKVWSEDHAKHCAKVLLKWALEAPGVEESVEWAHVSFGSCWQRRVPGL
ncbi:hypothetical protein DBV05_g9500 [Lasiodiplodia theobromae]|uniref:Uncharacterized protein n=2 Tax=Lasiodiplodia theobromae TaxID=45133 RepID=A0A5N5D3G5_9PEZI|nr:hypothetical protein DBV05_g9500 [Lasiodiplodia theobromae]